MTGRDTRRHSAAAAVVLTDIVSWAVALAALEAEGPLPARTAVVPTEDHAHALRVQLARTAPRVLIGTRFVTPPAAARAVLAAAGVQHRAGEELLRPLRVRKLRGGRASGWDEAYAHTIEQLEAACLAPDRLDQIGATELASLWRALDADAGASWSTPRLLAEARAQLVATPAAWPFDGPVLAAVVATLDAATAGFLCAIPNVTIAVVAARPVRDQAIERMRELYGHDAAQLAATDVPCPQQPGELGILSELLFEPPHRLAAATRRRSQGPDGTVTLELRAGVDDELDAVARWVATEVSEHGTPLHELAVLLPRPDPLAGLVMDRLAELPWPDVAPIYLACGRPATGTFAGGRLLAVVRALAHHLPIDAIIELLPRLRLDGDGGGGHASPRRAREAIARLAVLGGSPANPEGALRWGDRLDRLEGAAAGLVPAIRALVAVAAAALAGASLAKAWAAVKAFARDHLLGGRELPRLLDLLDEQLGRLAADPVTEPIVGHAAIELIVSQLEALRVDHGRYGEPAIYVGTVLEAAGLPFTSVFVLGLTEGAFPGTLRENPALSTEQRASLPPHSIVRDHEFALARFHAFDRVVRGTKRRLVVSCATTDYDDSEREPAALFTEIGAALARPNAITGEPSPTIPTHRDLERDAFAPARAIPRRAVPMTAGSWLERPGPIPARWVGSELLDPRAIRAHAWSHGVLGAAPLSVVIPGAEPSTPLSASTLATLLACPQRFLLERVLGMRPRQRHAEGDRIEPADLGALVHRVADRFAREHGEPFGRREGDLAGWISVADGIAHQEMDRYCDDHALRDGAVATERDRLRRQVRRFVEHDWSNGVPRELVASEHTFEALALSTPVAPLFVRGRIDRIDREGETLLVRDLKTGRPPRDAPAEPMVELDLQLAVYIGVVEQLGLAAGQRIEAAYVYLDPFAVDRERSHRADPERLRRAGARWLHVAAALLRERAFVPAREPRTCASCPFHSACGDGAVVARAALDHVGGALAMYREIEP